MNHIWLTSRTVKMIVVVWKLYKNIRTEVDVLERYICSCTEEYTDVTQCLTDFFVYKQFHSIPRDYTVRLIVTDNGVALTSFITNPLHPETGLPYESVEHQEEDLESVKTLFKWRVYKRCLLNDENVELVQKKIWESDKAFTSYAECFDACQKHMKTLKKKYKFVSHVEAVTSPPS